MKFVLHYKGQLMTYYLITRNSSFDTHSLQTTVRYYFYIIIFYIIILKPMLESYNAESVDIVTPELEFHVAGSENIDVIRHRQVFPRERR